MLDLMRSLFAHDFASLPSLRLPVLDGLFARMLNTNFCIVVMQWLPRWARLDDIIGLYSVAHQVGHRVQL